MKIFNGKSGRKPQTEARRYVYQCIATALGNNQECEDGWFAPTPNFDEFDRRRLSKAIVSIRKEMLRKAEK